MKGPIYLESMCALEGMRDICFLKIPIGFSLAQKDNISILGVRDIPLWVIELIESRQMSGPLASRPTNYQQQENGLATLL
ncbi:hypothetical protein U1Q18_016944 [Sarracenia purpurea var. burkii]